MTTLRARSLSIGFVFGVSALGTGLALLSGCGQGDAVASAPAAGVAVSSALKPKSTSALTDAFFIDDGVGVLLPEYAYAITVNGAAWALTWLGDAGFHTFTGSIYNGSTIDDVVFAGGFAGDAVTQPDASTVQFSASTDGSDIQSITLDSGSEPVSFDLYIDGNPAIGNVVYSSSGVLSTTDVMPFDLLTGAGARASRTAPGFTANRVASASRIAGLANGTSTARTPVFVPAPTQGTRSGAPK